MRLAPVPIAFLDDLEKGMQYASDQSYTTHDGKEAAECCRLLSFLTIKLIKRPEKTSFIEIFENIEKEFETSCTGVKAMAESRIETKEEWEKENYINYFNQEPEDRNWNWRTKSLYKYSPTRLCQNRCKF
jgi:ADP-ribosyl-[dinitrogen reductase] hydrolase